MGRQNTPDLLTGIYLTALISQRNNPSIVRIFDAFNRLTSGQQGEKP